MRVTALAAKKQEHFLLSRPRLEWEGVLGKPSLTQGTLCCILLSGSLGKGWVGAMGGKSCCVMIPWQYGRGTIIAVYLL